MKKLLLLITLLTCFNVNAVPRMTVTSSVTDGTLAIGESTTLTFMSSEPVTGGTFTVADVLIRGDGTLTNFTTINPSTYTATFTANQTEEIAILMDEGAYTSASGDSAMLQFGLNFQPCYTDTTGNTRYDHNKLVFPKFGQMVAGGGEINHVPCYRFKKSASRGVYKFEPARYKPILLAEGQYLAPDPSKQISHASSQNSVHNHTGNSLGTMDMTMMRYKGGATGTNEERVEFANHDSYTYDGQPYAFSHNALNGAARTNIGPLVVNGLRHQDNIVSRGFKIAGHLHGIHGNGGANYEMTPLQIQNAGTSNAHGGTINRSLYWQPAVIRMGTGEPVTNGVMDAYYKAWGGRFGDVSWFPDGLVMIAGFPPGHAGALDSKIASWTCTTATGDQVGTFSHIPHCKYDPNDSQGKVVQKVRFPSCWDGVNLDSADHMSHIAYAVEALTPFGNGHAVCPPSHPVNVPEISENIHIKLQPGDDTSTWGIASDNYPLSDPYRGKTLHADWVHGWKRSLALEWLAECQNMPIDCGNNYIGRTPPIEISTITHSGTTATATTPAPHGLRTGLLVQIIGADQSEYNGDTNVSFNINSMTCEVRQEGTPAAPVAVVSINHAVPYSFTGISWRTPITIVGADQAGFNVTDESDYHSNISNFEFRLNDTSVCPSANASGSNMKVLVDNGVPKQRVTVVDDYTFNYELPSVPSGDAAGNLFFRVGRALH